MLSNYKHDNNKIIKVQSLFRRYSVLKRNNTKCNNNEDFYTYELLSNIPTKYFLGKFELGRRLYDLIKDCDILHYHGQAISTGYRDLILWA